jgi:hypothetical protein
MSSFSGRYMFQGDKLARTPPKVVRFLQSIVRQHRPPTARCNVLELGAGEGHIAVSLVTDDLFADHANCFVERVPSASSCGHAKCVTARARAPKCRRSTRSASSALTARSTSRTAGALPTTRRCRFCSGCSQRRRRSPPAHV